MVQGSGATGTYHGQMSARIALATTSTANAATNWVNPETGTVLARVFVYFTTAGTGTFDLGRGSDGTGNANGAIDGGTMTVGVHHPGTVVGTAAASATLGIVDNSIFLIGPGNTGTNNSINMTHSDTTTSTAVGGMVVEYWPVGV
tara:strand:+ start:1680 stop:2114 length:435 start_codon:yes stop_codon:yes gene_type:complete